MNRKIELDCKLNFDSWNLRHLRVHSRTWRLTVYEPGDLSRRITYTLEQAAYDDSLVGEVRVSTCDFGVPLTMCNDSRQIVSMFLALDFEGIYSHFDSRSGGPPK